MDGRGHRGEAGGFGLPGGEEGKVAIFGVVALVAEQFRTFCNRQQPVVILGAKLTLNDVANNEADLTLLLCTLLVATAATTAAKRCGLHRSPT